MTGLNGHQEEGLSDPISYEKVKVCSDFILANTHHRPKIGIICGSGLDPLIEGLAELVTQPKIFSYENIPGFPRLRDAASTGMGRLVLGELGSVPVAILQGRFQVYEGYPMWMTALPVRVLKLIGVESLLVTNAAGGLNPMFTVGDIMVLKDHINLPGLACQHPLRGPNDERFGPRFFPTNDLYCKQYRDLAKQVARSLNLSGIVRQGVYAMLGGPNYETVAELKMLRDLKVDTVGLSTLPETIVAHHCGIKVFACSLITNMCVVEYNQDTNHDEVIEWGRKRANDMQEFLAKMVEAIYNNPQ